ncbi:MAG: sensor histidine kinase, partial [Candidatus Thiodiazotropha sp.]
DGTVSLMISEREREAVVSITDSGGGISEDDLPHIFEPFYKKRQAGKDGNHAGLGLAIARRMVELQGGTITATNSESGGACFSFTLPLVQSD